jgi:membrane dipeptidase
MTGNANKCISKRKIALCMILLLVVATLLFVFYFPAIIENKLNKKLDSEIPQLSPQAKSLHQTLFIADLHTDSLLWNRDLTQHHNQGHVDFPRLIEGNTALQTFSIVSKSPKNLNYQRNTPDSDNITLLAITQLWPVKTWNSLLQRALYQSQKLYKFQQASEGQFFVIRNKNELSTYLRLRKTNKNISAGWLSIEGAQVLEGKLENLSQLYDAGFRMIAPTHFFDTAISGSKHGVDKYGLTELGKRWVAEMNKRNMIIDLAHASDQTINDVLSLTSKPVIVSHTGVKGACDNNRNLSDQQIQQIASNGGVIGIGFWPSATCGNNLNAIAKSIRYVTNLVGIDHVAYGSDFDGAVATPIDTSEMSYLTQALIDNGFSEAEIRKISGGNTLKFLASNLPE